jgi:hypothetical protein
LNTRQRILRILYTLVQSVGVLAAVLTIFASLVSGTIVLSIIRANGSIILITLVAIGAGIVVNLLMVLSISFIKRRRYEAAQAEKRISEIDQLHQVDLQRRSSLIEVSSMRLQLLQGQIEELIREKERLEEQARFAKEQLEEEKRRHFLEKQEQSIEWQKEAIALVDISPRAAIIIAWIGIEKELQHTARRLETNVKPLTLDQIGFLRQREKIDKETEETLLSMSRLRAKIVHGVYEEEVTRDMALTFVQQAIEIAEKLFSIEAFFVSD